MSNANNQLRLNVGFLLNAPVGESRDFDFYSHSFPLEPDLDLSDLSGTARITRTAQGLLVQAKMSASLSTECVRCLTGFSQPLTAQFTELYAFTREAMTDSGLRVPDDAHIDLTPLAREYMLLAVPIGPLCSPDCRGLCPTCGANLNEITCNHAPDTVDPRLLILKSLLDKKE